MKEIDFSAFTYIVSAIPYWIKEPFKGVDDSIKTLGLTTRSERCLWGMRIRTIENLISRTAKELLECSSFGEQSLINIRDRLSKIGLKLHGE